MKKITARVLVLVAWRLSDTQVKIALARSRAVRPVKSDPGGAAPQVTRLSRAGVPPRPAGQAQPGQQQQPATEEQLRIVADPATNSLIVYGTAQEFQNMKNILKDLDAIPRQVLIEAMVAAGGLEDYDESLRR